MKTKPSRAARRKPPAKRAYDASGRRAEAERTTSRIVEAATQLVKEGVLPENLTYADVSARAGVAARTVYRHFPETNDLLHAVAVATLTELTQGELVLDLPRVAAQLRRTQQALCADPSLFRVFLVTPLREGMDYENYMRTIFADVLKNVPEKYRDAAAAIFEILSNPFAWHVLHSYWQLPPEQITRTCLAAVQAVADRFQREPELLDPSAPLPALFRLKGAASSSERSEKGERKGR